MPDCVCLLEADLAEDVLKDDVLHGAEDVLHEVRVRGRREEGVDVPLLARVQLDKLVHDETPGDMGRLIRKCLTFMRKITVEGGWGEREMFLQCNLIQEQIKREERFICKKVRVQKVDMKRTELEF
jgi:hypothetical protein